MSNVTNFQIYRIYAIEGAQKSLRMKKWLANVRASRGPAKIYNFAQAWEFATRGEARDWLSTDEKIARAMKTHGRYHVGASFSEEPPILTSVHFKRTATIIDFPFRPLAVLRDTVPKLTYQNTRSRLLMTASPQGVIHYNYV